MRRILRSSSAALALALIAGCATAPGTRPPPPPGTAVELFDAGMSAAQSGDYDRAQDMFRKLEVYYPDDKRALQSEIESVYAYYQAHDYASAVAAAARFIRRHPDHPNLDYLFYLRGLARFDEALEIFSALPADAPSERPPSADLALEDFSDLIARYPQSRYSEDARNRVKHLRQKLAEFELETAKLYLNKGNYVSAELHARTVIDRFPDAGLATDAATVVNMARRMLDMDSISSRPPKSVPLPQKTPAPPPEAEPAAKASPSAPVELQREAWIRGQNAAAYTLQLFSTSREDVLVAFVRRHRLEGAAYYRSDAGGAPRYSLLYGLYDTPESARAAAEKLPAELRGEKPWIRRISEVQALIRQEAASTP